MGITLTNPFGKKVDEALGEVGWSSTPNLMMKVPSFLLHTLW